LPAPLDREIYIRICDKYTIRRVQGARGYGAVDANENGGALHMLGKNRAISTAVACSRYRAPGQQVARHADE
jgi:hypothetical protein